ncbi:MAG: ABC transporter ATP-binding protein [Okeania sp. SIO2D1]|nr:ABC transporter ATP-binding protein [Okeania sp. SIO2D1]
MEDSAIVPVGTPASARLPVVQTWGLGKVYRTGFWLDQKIESLSNLSMSVYEGETFGVLGPNGAGKTTLLKILLGIIRPTSGKAMLLGKPIGNQQVKQHLGYLPENPYFYDFLTGWEFLEYTAGLFQIPREEQRKRIPQLLGLVGLTQAAAKKKQLRQYSKGMLQRVGMAQALINNPDIVFLDEPMSGLDPLGRYQISQMILSLKEQGKTIFFNSHVLGDVETICDRVAILNQGELLCLGSLDELLGTIDAYQVSGRGGNLEVLQRWVKNLHFKENCWYGELQGEPQEFIATVRLMDAQLISMGLTRMSLEEFFVEKLGGEGGY